MPDFTFETIEQCSDNFVSFKAFVQGSFKLQLNISKKDYCIEIIIIVLAFIRLFSQPLFVSSNCPNLSSTFVEPSFYPLN